MNYIQGVPGDHILGVAVIFDKNVHKCVFSSECIDINNRSFIILL